MKHIDACNMQNTHTHTHTPKHPSEAGALYQTPAAAPEQHSVPEVRPGNGRDFKAGHRGFWGEREDAGEKQVRDDRER